MEASIEAFVEDALEATTDLVDVAVGDARRRRSGCQSQSLDTSSIPIR